MGATEQRVVIKQRRLALSDQTDPSGVAAALAPIRTLPGMIEAQLSGATLQLTYDLLQISLAEIQSRLHASGIDLGSAALQRYRLALVHYLEDNERDHQLRPTGWRWRLEDIHAAHYQRDAQLSSHSHHWQTHAAEK
jgi:Allophanate hydrolase subunit 1